MTEEEIYTKSLEDFFLGMWEKYCDACYEIDLCDMHELAEKLGLVKAKEATQVDVDGCNGDIELGDDIYYPIDRLKDKG